MRKRATAILVAVLLTLIGNVAYGVSRRSRVLTVRATAYCPCAICCGKYADGKTATGRSAFKPGVAVDPQAIPLGAHLDIPGYTRGPNGNGSWIRADDTGRLIKGNRIDVRFRSHEEAVQWGTRTIRVRIWEN